MATTRSTPETVEEYIARCPPNVRSKLERIRRIVHRAAPDAEEKISYRIPTFTLNGVLLHVAAFTNQLGLFPPVRGDARIEKAVARYAGPKGNLRFPLDEPMPYTLIERIAALRVKQNLAKASATKQSRRR